MGIITLTKHPLSVVNGRQADATASGLKFVPVVFSYGMAGRSPYPPPWRIEENHESYVVTDSAGQKLAYVYFADESIRQGIMGRMTKDHAWQLARAITRIPGLLRRD
jgi:hypothetical protein